MRLRRTPKSNKVFSLPGGTEDNDAWVEQLVLGDGDVPTDDPCHGAPALRMVYEIDAADRRRIANGANIELNIIGTGMPPVMLRTTYAAIGKDSVER